MQILAGPANAKVAQSLEAAAFHCGPIEGVKFETSWTDCITLWATAKTIFMRRVARQMFRGGDMTPKGQLAGPSSSTWLIDHSSADHVDGSSSFT